MRRLLSKAVGRGGGEDTKAESDAADNAAAALAGGKLAKKLTKAATATKHQRRRARGGLGCITAQPESSPSPEPKQHQNPAGFLDATSQFVGLTFDPFR